MNVPFDAAKLDRLMAEAGLDLVLAHTRHNVRYLTGGYYYHFHANATRMGRSQYLAFVGIPRSRVQEAFFVGRPDERGQMEAESLWIPGRVEAIRGTVTAAEGAVKALQHMGLTSGRIGVEMPFLPADAWLALRAALPDVDFVDATPLLSELRAVKSGEELAILRAVYAGVAEVIRDQDAKIAIEGHTDAAPFRGDQITNWELSTGRASAARRMLETNGTDPLRVARVVGYADTDLLVKENPKDPQNRRISIILLQPRDPAPAAATVQKEVKAAFQAEAPAQQARPGTSDAGRHLSAGQHAGGDLRPGGQCLGVVRGLVCRVYCRFVVQPARRSGRLEPGDPGRRLERCYVHVQRDHTGSSNRSLFEKRIPVHCHRWQHHSFIQSL